MEKVEIAVRVLSSCYGLAIIGLIKSLLSYSLETIIVVTVFTLAFTCPFLWAIIRFCRDYAARKKESDLPDKAPKKKPDIAVPKDKQGPRTQAQILAEQRAKVKNLHQVQDKKMKKSKFAKPPARKTPPSSEAAGAKKKKDVAKKV